MNKGLQRCLLASMRGFAPPTPRLGEPSIGKNHVPSKAIKARFYKEIHAFKPKLIPALKS